ncbi:hypothetical protein EON80_24870 [bacterium]|nr:MAG: hypothetical protein EON80_24870 [bacterium]
MSAYLAHISTVYFFLKWTPTLVVKSGFDVAQAAGVLVWANGGSVLGAIVATFVVRYAKPGHAILASLLLSGLAVASFGMAPVDLTILLSIAFVVGLAMSASVTFFFAVLVQVFPVNLRAGAIGFVVGMGRGGAAIGPILAGLIFSLGAGRGQASVIFGFGSILAAVAMLFVMLRQKNAPKSD